MCSFLAQDIYLQHFREGTFTPQLLTLMNDLHMKSEIDLTLCVWQVVAGFKLFPKEKMLTFLLSFHSLSIALKMNIRRMLNLTAKSPG
jgi:hypothetical protein